MSQRLAGSPNRTRHNPERGIITPARVDQVFVRVVGLDTERGADFLGHAVVMGETGVGDEAAIGGQPAVFAVQGVCG